MAAGLLYALCMSDADVTSTLDNPGWTTDSEVYDAPMDSNDVIVSRQKPTSVSNSCGAAVYNGPVSPPRQVWECDKPAIYMVELISGGIDACAEHLAKAVNFGFMDADGARTA